MWGNNVAWKSKKQNGAAWSSVEAMYRVIASFTCEIVWIKQFLQALKFCGIQYIRMYRNNQATLHIASNPVQERTKHIEITYHFIPEKLLSKEISTKFVSSNDQLAYIF